MNPTKDTTPINNNDQPDITIYDKHGYDYSKYWERRSYEHRCEVAVLSSMLKNTSGTWFIDIGGSYGRHIPQYHRKFHNCVLVDYSFNALKQAAEECKKQGIKNVTFVAANIYNLPFRNEVFDAGMMVRVAHHLEDLEKAFSEITRIFKTGSTFILEFANKKHLKAIIRALLTFNFGFLISDEPIEVPVQNPEGATKEDDGIILNYTLRRVEGILASLDTKTIRNSGVSYLRIPLLKRGILGKLETAWVKLDAFISRFFSWLHISPSIFLKNIVRPTSSDTKIEAIFSSIEDILVCPKCKNPLSQKEGRFVCSKCSLTFEKKDGVYNFRYPLLKE